MKPITFEELLMTKRPRPTAEQESEYIERKIRMDEFWASTRLKGVRRMADSHEY